MSSRFLSRRSFLELLALSGAGLAARPSVQILARSGPAPIEADVVVYGAGASGLCAAVQAARLGTRVVLIEPTVWVGGKLTAAGVSALDGNKYGLGSGLVKEFRDRLLAHYGSDEALFSGWVSLTCYEPHIGEGFLRELAAPLESLQILFETDVVSYEHSGPRERLIRTRGRNGSERDLVTPVFIDCSEYGDGLALAGIPYRLGRESRDELGESAAPERADSRIQDLTYVAILQRRTGVDPVVGDPTADSYWDFFRCSTLEDCPNPDPEVLNHTVHDWQRFITYGALPNDKVMLNWPHHANDYPVPPAFFEDRFYRRTHLAAARQHTLQYVSYLRKGLGHVEWELATDEYPTPDRLPLIPYMRESRRMVNGRIMVQDEVVADGDRPRAPIQEDAIAVGDYFLDHHHAEHHLPPAERLIEDYPDSKPFQIPLRACLPSNGDPCFLAGEKNIAVSHIVNGCTRLQPVVMLIGQALGVVSALAAQRNIAPVDVPVRDVQRVLIRAGAQVYPVYDLYRSDPGFVAVQELALVGLLDDRDPVNMEPDRPVHGREVQEFLRRAGLEAQLRRNGSAESLSARDFGQPLRKYLPARRGPVTRGDFYIAFHAVAAPLHGLQS